jgi:hypothetical protein
VCDGFDAALVVLRLVNGVVLDHPFAAEVRFPLWAATLDVDAPDPFGWRRSLWPGAPGGRGWVPQVLHFGDVVEFGSYHDPVQRWFGWYTHHAGDGITGRSHRRATLRWMPSRPAASSSVGRCSTISDRGCMPQRRSADGPAAHGTWPEGPVTPPTAAVCRRDRARRQPAADQ